MTKSTLRRGFRTLTTKPNSLSSIDKRITRKKIKEIAKRVVRKIFEGKKK